MRPLLACWRLSRVLLHGLHGLLLVLLLFPWLKAAQRQPHIAWWSAKLLRVLGMRLQLQGQFSPGATLVVAVIRDSPLLVGHVGDSRAYRLRGGRLQQITRDHSLLQEQIDACLLYTSPSPRD